MLVTKPQTTQTQSPAKVWHQNVWPQKVWLAVLVASTLIFASAALPAQASIEKSLLARFSDRQQAMLNSLNLSPSQQQQATALQQKTRSTRASALMAMTSTATLVKRDLANPQSNLRATMQMVQSTFDQQLAQHRALTEERLRFYETLTPAQQAQVRQELIARIEKMERLRDAMMALSADF